MELKQYFYIARKWLWLIILGIVLGGGAAFLFSYFQEPVYRSAAKALVSQPSRDQLSDFGYYSAQQLVSTYSELLQTSPILEEVSNRLDHHVSASAISIQQVRDTNILSVSVEDGNPERAAEIANTLIQVLVEQNETLLASRFASSEESLRSQINVVQEQITTLQSEIASETQASRQTQISTVEEQIAFLQDDIVKIQLEISALEGAGDDRFTATTPDPETLSKINQLHLDLEQKQGLLDLYQELYFNLLSSETSGSASTDVNPATNQYQSTLALYQQIYANLLRDYEAVRLSRLENTPTVVSVEPAVPDYQPIRPKPVTNTLLGTVVGLMIAGGIVFLVEYLDDTIKSPEEASRLSNTPVIGFIPSIQYSGSNGRYGVYSLDNPRSPIAEAFRSLRTNIEFAAVPAELNSLLITSSGPKEGKSTVASNLAAIMVQGGKKVAIVDADLRRPFLHKYYQFENRLGLSEYFRNEISLKESFKYVDSTERLIAIPSGKLPPNPAELLSSAKMTTLLEELAEEVDFVILDSPPLVVTDPVVLSTKVDGVLFVVHPTITKYNSAKASLEQLERAQARLVGIVMNNINKQSSYYYQNYYQYHDYQSTTSEV